MMWLKKREWLIFLFSLILVIAGGAYYYFSPDYKEHFIHNIGVSANIWEVPQKSGNNVLVIKVEGYTNENYSLKLDFYNKNVTAGKSFQKTHSEIVRFPAGDIHGTLKRDFYGEPDNSKINISYLPEHQSDARGVIKLKVGIF